MFLSHAHTDLEAIRAAISELRGEELALTRINHDEVGAVHQALQNPAFYGTAGFDTPPNEARVRNLFVEREHLIIWQAKRLSDGAHLGHCGWSDFAGPAFVFFVPAPNTVPDLMVIFEALELVGVPYFEMTPAQELFIYVDRPVDDETHEMLVENGFDPWEQLPSIDNEKEAGYSMSRETFTAYYGDQDDDI